MEELVCWIKRHKTTVAFALVLLLLPFICALIQAAKPPELLPITTGEFLSYYAVVGTVIWGIGSYFYEKHGEDSRRRIEYRADFVVEVIPESVGFTIAITNSGAHGLKNVSLYGKKAISWLESGETFKRKVIIGTSQELAHVIGVTAEVLIVDPNHEPVRCDDEGYPSYVTINSQDLLKTEWISVFDLHSTDEGKSYILEIVEWCA